MFRSRTFFNRAEEKGKKKQKQLFSGFLSEKEYTARSVSFRTTTKISKES